MILRQFILDDLSSAAYLVGDAASGLAAVVDPHLDVETYEECAAFYGVRIAHVLETHSHADRVSGHGLLAARGATIHIHQAAEAAYPHESFVDGWVLELGHVRIRALHTPGHRPEHTAFVLSDSRRGPDPWAVLTGDSLFVSDTARPDLAVEPGEGARDLFNSLHEGLLLLPPETEVWPGHLGGSLCGGPSMDMKTSSTIGYERAHNPLLAVSDEDEFVQRVTAGLPPQPANFHGIVEINRGPIAEPVGPPEIIDADELADRMAAGIVAFDPRDEAVFDAGHVPGALSNPAARGGFANRMAWLADPDDDVIVLAGPGHDGARLARLAASVGMRQQVAVLPDAVAAWTASGRTLTGIERAPAASLAELREADPELRVLDVRERAEWDVLRLADAMHIPYHDLAGRLTEVAAGSRVAVICASGQRAGVATSILARDGRCEPIHLVDGGVAEALAERPALGASAPA